jgi:2-keto-3-deoxy-L-rhamnonate aldolase RhmA
MGEDIYSDVIMTTVQKIVAASKAAGTAAGLFTPKLDELPDWRRQGASLFLLSSDQSILLAGANQLATVIRN